MAKEDPTKQVIGKAGSILSDSDAGDKKARDVIDAYRKHRADPSNEGKADEARGAFGRWFGGKGK
jgi:hypothetical protein